MVAWPWNAIGQFIDTSQFYWCIVKQLLQRDPFYRDKKFLWFISGEIETCDIIESGLDYSSPSSLKLVVSLCSIWNLIYRNTELCWVLNFSNGDIWRVVGSKRFTDLCWFLRLLPNQTLLLQILCMTLSPQVWKSSTPYLQNIVNLVYLGITYIPEILWIKQEKVVSLILVSYYFSDIKSW